VVLAVIASGFALSVAKPLLIPLVFALMLFFLLRPPVRWLTQRGVPRTLASTLVLGAALGLLVLSVVELSGPAMTWSQRMPNAVREFEQKSRELRYPFEHVTRAAQAVNKLAEVGRPRTVPQVDVVKPNFIEGLLAQAGRIAAQIGLTVGAAFFMLVDGDALLSRLIRLGSPQPGSKRSTAVINEVGVRMSRYLGAVTLVNLGLGVALTITLALLRMPNPWLWGGLAAVLTYVPYVGPAIGIGLVTLASVVTFPTLGTALAPPLAYLVLASIEGNLVTPFVLGRTCAVRPLVIFVWLALWAWLWSVPGAILAVPLLMLVRFVCDESPRLGALAYLLRR
jgi:predicted PurR-regulated permease PerM